MKQIPRIPKLTALPKPTLPLGQAALAFLLSAARLGGAHVPFGLGMISAAGAKLPGLFCLLGAAVGAWAFLDFQTALRYLASGILIFSVNTAFYDTKIYTRPFFRSLASVAATAVVQFLYLLERGAASLVVFALSWRQISSSPSSPASRIPYAAARAGCCSQALCVWPWYRCRPSPAFLWAGRF